VIPRAVLFDAAGTLIELREPIGETYGRLAEDFGVKLPAWRISEAFGRILRRAEPMVFPGEAPERIAQLERDWWRGVVRSTFLATDGTARFSDFGAYFDRLYRHYTDAECWRARPGALEVLGAIREQGLATAVVSNFDQRLPGILAGLGMAALVDAIVLPAEAGAAKPDPRIFAFALDKIGALAGESVFVGDDGQRDLAGARRAGLYAIDVARLATLAELPNRLEALRQQTPA
jgi:putative hydrolase of the HAD superfamily